jgi:protoporphyrinogen oxidase
LGEAGVVGMNIAVLGAGVSGLTIARKLADRGYDVTIYEQCERPGGLAKTRITNGFTYDLHGGHVFNSKYKEVVDWVFSILPVDSWQYTVRNAKIFFEGKYVSYPFELSLCELDVEHAVECAYDFLLAQQGEEPKGFKNWLVWNFGKSIADYYMIPYNSKIWSYPLEDMETSWISGKMPLPEKKDILRSLVMKNPSERKMPHSTFYYPIYGGIQTMVDAIATPLSIISGFTVERIEQVNNSWYINGEGPYEQIISTIPLKALTGAMDLPEKINNAIKGLKYNSLTTILFECPPTDISWLYIPSMKYRAHRACYQSSLTPNATPSIQIGSGAVEIIGVPFEIDSNYIKGETVMPKELGAGKQIDSEFTEYAYVIHDKDYQQNTSQVLDYFNNIDQFSLLGRWGNWNYDNMDICMYKALKLADIISSTKR